MKVNMSLIITSTELTRRTALILTRSMRLNEKLTHTMEATKGIFNEI